VGIDTYAQLLTALGAFSKRSDQAALWPLCITLADAQMAREVRVRPMDEAIEYPIEYEYEGVPSGMIAVKSFTIRTGDANNPTWQLEYLDQGTMALYRQQEGEWRSILASEFTTSNPPPRYYTIIGDRFQFFPTPDREWTADLVMTKQPCGLSPANPSNWILCRHPDAYLYGALVQFGIMAQDERLPNWTSAYTAAVEAINRAYPEETVKTRLRTEVAAMAGRRPGRTGRYI